MNNSLQQAKIEGEMRKIHNTSVMSDPAMKEAAEEMNYFTGEIFLSTDGKHTVHIQADTAAGRTAGGKWAVEVYKSIVKELGTKPQLWEEVMKNGKEKKAPPKTKTCECGGTKTFRQGVSKTTGKKWAGWFCDNEQCPYSPEFIHFSSKV